MSKLIVSLLVLLVLSSAPSASAEDECSRTGAMEVFSNAFVHPETGDVLGYELALKRHDDSKVEAFLFFYEGVPNSDAIPLFGHLSGKHLSLEGEWVEHLIEYPSRKGTLEKYFVKIQGVLGSVSFRGHVEFEGMDQQRPVRLKRVGSIWLCNK